MIVSHHGELENGALRPPMFPEAFALFVMDLLDARLDQAWRLIDQTAEGEEWTAYVPSLQCRLLRGFIPLGIQETKDGGRAAAPAPNPGGC